MKALFKTLAATALSAAITLSSFTSFAISGAEADTEEKTTVFLSYSYDADNVVIPEEGADLFTMPAEISMNSNIEIPDVEPELENYIFSGWTDDDIHLYEPGDVYRVLTEDVVLEAVWIPTADAGDLDQFSHTLSYKVEIDGVVPEEGIPVSETVFEGQPIRISIASFHRDGYTQIGWTDGTNDYLGDEKIFMKDKDIVLEPKWHKYYYCWYKAGDVDRINGSTAYVFERYATNPFDIATSDRFSRTGFNLTGWTCDYDGQVYRPGTNYIMPDCDVTFTAVWTPKTYTVLFKSNNKKNENIKVAGETDTAIIVPECESTYDGYVFAGWQFNDEIYQPGDEFIVPGALPGLGISLSAIWLEEGSYTDIPVDSVSFAHARALCVAGEITEDELLALADHVMNN